MALPAYYEPSIVSERERIWFCALEPFLLNIPLIVTSSILSVWRPHDFYARKNSDTFSIEAVIRGDMVFVQNGRRHLVEAGSAFLVHKGADSRFETGPAGFVHKRAVTMDGIMLDVALHSLGLKSKDVLHFRSSALLPLFKRANRLIGEAEPGYEWSLSLLAYQILLELARGETVQTYPEGITRAISFMSKNVTQQLTLEQIAEAGQLSRFHFARLFRRSVNCSPMTYFVNQKMSLACNLLRNSGLLIKEIAAILGYEDPFYFTAQFRKVHGISPRQFRLSQTPS